MANGMPSTNAHQTTIDLGALNQRVTGLETTLVGISGQLDSVRKSLAEGGKTQWPVLIGIGALIFTIISGVGWITYTPIRESIGELKADSRALAERLALARELSVSQREFDTYRTNSNNAIRELRSETIPRNVAEERNRSQDQAIVNQQRQIDDLKKQQGEIYSARDVILDLKQRLDRYEMRGRGSNAPS